jgi:Na+-translocating ferredoxin:NAD+ oxidoreductase subunit G
MDSPKKSSLRAIILVVVIAIVASVIVSGSYEISADRILKNQQDRQLATLDELLQNSIYDEIIENFNVAETINISRDLRPIPVYIAIHNRAPIAVVYSAGSSQGYNGPIHMLVGINMNGNITGVRIISHRETPGLGDQIEIEKSNWITNFNQKNISNPSLPQWKVTKDGGKFDGFTSATITARAVIHTVRDALMHFEQNKENYISGSITLPTKNGYE